MDKVLSYVTVYAKSPTSRLVCLKTHLIISFTSDVTRSSNVTESFRELPLLETQIQKSHLNLIGGKRPTLLAGACANFKVDKPPDPLYLEQYLNTTITCNKLLLLDAYSRVMLLS